MTAATTTFEMFFDTAEIEPCKVCPLSVYRSPRLASYEELKPHDSTYNFPGWGLMGAQFLQIAIFGDFMYIYVKSIRSNSRLVLPDKIINL